MELSAPAAGAQVAGAGPGGQCQGLRREEPVPRNIGETACFAPDSPPILTTRAARGGGS
jgi:hypothetical protein